MRRLLLTKPCPSCGKAHGHSAWAVAQSSLISPLSCPHCATGFHQPGLRMHVIGLLALPTTVMSFGLAAGIKAHAPMVPEGLAVALGVMAVTAVSAALVLYWVNRRYPLVHCPPGV
jgi:hypothetical protein